MVFFASASGSGNIFSNNVASNNGDSGFRVQGSGQVLTNNLAVGNDVDGISIVGSGHQITGNGILGNKRFGLILFGGNTASVTKNNIYGNNIFSFVVDLISYTNCGVFNTSGNAINLTNNFWGVATEPGFTEPADDVCVGTFGSSHVFALFATKEFKIKVKISDEFSSALLPVEREMNTSHSNQAASLKLYTLAGQLLVIFSEEKSFELASLNLPNGLYLAVRAYADGRRELIKFAVKR